jgi:hypothetical protein
VRNKVFWYPCDKLEKAAVLEGVDAVSGVVEGRAMATAAAGWACGKGYAG